MTATPTLREELQLLASVNNASNLVFHVNTVNSCQHKCGCIIIFFLKSVKKCFASVVSNCVHLLDCYTNRVNFIYLEGK